MKQFNISSRFGKSSSWSLGYISFNNIAKFSIAWFAAFTLYASSTSKLLLLEEYNPFKTVEIATAVWVASSRAKGFNPTEDESLGSIKLNFMLRAFSTFLIWFIDSISGEI